MVVIGAVADEAYYPGEQCMAVYHRALRALRVDLVFVTEEIGRASCRERV